MKMLLSTTALVVALGFPMHAFAQTNASAANQANQQQNAQMPGFLAKRGQSDLFASDLMGHDVYVRRGAGENTATNNQAASSSDRMNAMATMNRADLDEMDNIGEINEIVLSNDGQVRALVIGAGGFLGMGERDVAVTMDQVEFASDADDGSKMYIVVNAGAGTLRTAPAYDRTAAVADRTEDKTDARSDRTAFAAPDMNRDGYNRVAVTDVSSEMLVGKSVYGVNEDAVGTIDDLILDDKGAITNVIIDFGGFLGIGTSQISVNFDELTILANEGRSDVRVYVDATKEQIQAQPKYKGSVN